MKDRGARERSHADFDIYRAIENTMSIFNVHTHLAFILRSLNGKSSTCLHSLFWPGAV